MFDPIIEQYHGHKKGAIHTSDMDHSKLVCPPFPEEDASIDTNYKPIDTTMHFWGGVCVCV